MAWWKRDHRGPALAAAVEEKRVEVPAGVWSKCKGCGEILLDADLADARGVCPACDFHHPLSWSDRVDLLTDPGTFEPIGESITPQNPLDFVDSKDYDARLGSATKRSGLTEAIVTGVGRLDGMPLALGVMAFEFLGGSMGSVVGERITRMFEAAVDAADQTFDQDRRRGTGLEDKRLERGLGASAPSI